MEKLLLAGVLLLLYVAHSVESRPAGVKYSDYSRGDSEALRRGDGLLLAIRHVIRERRETLPLLERLVASARGEGDYQQDPSFVQVEEHNYGTFHRSNRQKSQAFADRGGWGGGYGR